MAIPYAELLKKPAWQKKRLRVLERDNFTCQYCGDTETELHIHHTKYEKGKSPITISEQYLITLCKDCHFNVTYLKDGIESMLYYWAMLSEIEQGKRIEIRNFITKNIKLRNK